jgi:hypothetical protein
VDISFDSRNTFVCKKKIIFFFKINFRKVNYFMMFSNAMENKTMFVFHKLFSKLSCVCLPLEKLINGKHFSVKEIWAENIFRKL